MVYVGMQLLQSRNMASTLSMRAACRPTFLATRASLRATRRLAAAPRAAAFDVDNSSILVRFCPSPLRRDHHHCQLCLASYTLLMPACPSVQAFPRPKKPVFFAMSLVIFAAFVTLHGFCCTGGRRRRSGAGGHPQAEGHGCLGVAAAAHRCSQVSVAQHAGAMQVRMTGASGSYPAARVRAGTV